MREHGTYDIAQRSCLLIHRMARREGLGDGDAAR
jgi:hypothetical protein